jgi:release factor glutamine methyltransferase
MAAEQGMADLVTLVENAPVHLCAGGWLLLEHGHNQGAQLRSLLAQQGFGRIETRRDLSGLERVSGGQWHAQ